MTTFNIKIEEARREIYSLDEISMQLKEQAKQIYEAKNSLDESFDEIIPVLESLSARTRGNGSYVSLLGDTLRRIVYLYSECENRILEFFKSIDNNDSEGGSTDNNQTSDVSQKEAVEGLSEEGFQILCEYEVPGAAVYDENGNIIGLEIMDVGDGKFTLGFGVTVDKDDTDTIQWYKETYGIDIKVGEVVNLDISYRIYKEKELDYKNAVNNLCSRYAFSPTQQQYDALFLAIYNRPKLANQGHALDNFIKSGGTDRDIFYEELINEYKTLNGWDTYCDGWTNRILDEMEIFFDGDYVRSH